MNRKNFIKAAMLLICSMMIFAGCKKDEPDNGGTVISVPSVTTAEVSSITGTTATCGGNVTSDGGTSVTARGVCWSTTENPTISNNKTTDGNGVGVFTSSMTGLTENTTYYIRAYAINQKGTAYGVQKSFTTDSVTIVGNPIVITAEVSSITETTAICGGNVTSDGGTAVTVRGVCWSTTENPTIDNNKTSDGSGTGTFTSPITGLSANTTYYVRAYATNSQGTAYGSQKTFTTLQTVILPIVTTNVITDITQTTAICGGEVTTDNGNTVTARGVCWSTSQNPTTDNSKTTDGSGIGTFTSSITGLSANTTYYVRAYATNSQGTAYGVQKSFTTLQIETLPVVTTNVITNITETTATSGGNVTSDGGVTVTARGVCWSTAENPTISNNYTTNGSGTGTFTSSLTGLSTGITYYVRAYATNEKGTAYGNQQTFIIPFFGDGVIDADGNTYASVIIGNQEWMAENLKTTKYNNGTNISNITDNSQWGFGFPAYCWYNNDPEQGCGALYNWYAVNTGNLCPTGWHVPSDAEWTALTDYLHSQGYTTSDDAIPLKATTGWYNNGTDVYGFSAFPCGNRYNSGSFDNVGYYGFWWSSTWYDTNNAHNRLISYNSGSVISGINNKQLGFSVRCLRD